jgi:hypothetical protein
LTKRTSRRAKKFFNLFETKEQNKKNQKKEKIKTKNQSKMKTNFNLSIIQKNPMKTNYNTDKNLFNKQR